MTSAALLPQTSPHNSLSRPRARSSSRPKPALRPVENPDGRDWRVLARYRDWRGSPREVIARDGRAGSVLVIDRDGGTCGDSRLVAHLFAEEPLENAALVCAAYLQDAQARRFRCRAMTPQDETSVPAGELDCAEGASCSSSVEVAGWPVDRFGCAYRLELVAGRMSIPEVRWCRRSSAQLGERGEPVSLREVIGRLESYEPMRALTLCELATRERDSRVSTTVLGAEAARVQESPIVLNRCLREAVLLAIERQHLSMSEIAIRCGRVKHDGNGNESGETSWLARRLGLLPEGGLSTPTPWVHSDVLALIARRGLGISPREAEVP